MTEMDYKKSGVDIIACNQTVERIKPYVKRTHTKNVLTGLGVLGHCFPLKIL